MKGRIVFAAIVCSYGPRNSEAGPHHHYILTYVHGPALSPNKSIVSSRIELLLIEIEINGTVQRFKLKKSF